jgi:hypothetical protein
MLRPYLRIRPALWVQTRLYREYRQHDPMSVDVPLARHIPPTAFPISRRSIRNVPATGALSVGPRAGEPDGFVRHGCEVSKKMGTVRGRWISTFSGEAGTPRDSKQVAESAASRERAKSYLDGRLSRICRMESRIARSDRSRWSSIGEIRCAVGQAIAMVCAPNLPTWRQPPAGKPPYCLPLATSTIIHFHHKPNNLDLTSRTD